MEQPIDKFTAIQYALGAFAFYVLWCIFWLRIEKKFCQNQEEQDKTRKEEHRLY